MLYSSIENKKIKEIKKLYNKKYRQINDLFIVEGKHLVMEAYKNNLLVEVLLDEETDLQIDVKKNYATDNVLRYISELDTPNKIIGICKKIEEKPLKNKILILDDIQDPGNLGTIIRSAVAFNIDTIILSPNTVDIYNPKVLRATQGMIFNINIITKDLYDFIPKLKKDGYKIMCTKVNGGNDIKNIENRKKFAIIVGNEGKGVNDNLIKLSDEYIYINMNENCESLNVGVATSIILYELSR